MATETVVEPRISAQSWPHEGLLIRADQPAVIFNSDASLQELLAWVHGQTQMAVRLLSALIPEPQNATQEGHALGAVHAMLEPVQAALELAVDRLELAHG